MLWFSAAPTGPEHRPAASARAAAAPDAACAASCAPAGHATSSASKVILGSGQGPSPAATTKPAPAAATAAAAATASERAAATKLTHSATAGRPVQAATASAAPADLLIRGAFGSQQRANSGAGHYPGRPGATSRPTMPPRGCGWAVSNPMRSDCLQGHIYSRRGECHGARGRLGGRRHNTRAGLR